MPKKPPIDLKATRPIENKVMEHAKNSPDKMIQYIESLPDDIQQHDDPGNLLNYLYQMALKSRSRIQPS